jgi:hypothetical protein
MDALYARFLAESRRRDHSAESGLDALLAQARERGYRRLEIEMLHLVALRHYERGDMPAYRARLEQALATALNAGDLYEQRLLELHLLNEDFLRGQFDSASRRVESLSKVRLQGDIPVWLSSYEAIILAQRGRLAMAENVLNQGEKRDRDSNPGQDHTEAAARFACVRADLRPGMGDMRLARANWKKCGAPESPSSRLQAKIGNATVDLVAGDRTTSQAQLLAAQEEVAQLPDGRIAGRPNCGSPPRSPAPAIPSPPNACSSASCRWHAPRSTSG